MGAALGVVLAPGNGGLLERARVPLAALLLGVAACHGDAAPAHAVPGDHGPTIVVEVLNASGKPGNARVGTRMLRRAGIDVVYFGNAPTTLGIIDSTRIIVRRGGGGGGGGGGGSKDLGERVRRLLGVGRVEIELDSARLLDASVLLGADFAPRQAFHP